VWSIIRFAGQAPFRFRPLSSNVSQHARKSRRLPSLLGRQWPPKTKRSLSRVSWSLGTDSAALLKLHGKRARPSVLGRCSAATNPCHSKLRSFKPVSWAAVRRQAVPALKGSCSPLTSSHRFKSIVRAPATKARASSPHVSSAWYQRCPPPKVLANPSLEPGPPPASHLARDAPLVYAAPRGPSAFPAPAPQLKR